MAFNLQHKYFCVTMNNHITNWNNFTVISATYLQDLYDNKCISYVKQAWEMLVLMINWLFEYWCDFFQFSLSLHISVCSDPSDTCIDSQQNEKQSHSAIIPNNTYKTVHFY